MPKTSARLAETERVDVTEAGRPSTGASPSISWQAIEIATSSKIGFVRTRYRKSIGISAVEEGLICRLTIRPRRMGRRSSSMRPPGPRGKWSLTPHTSNAQVREAVAISGAA